MAVLLIIAWRNTGTSIAGISIEWLRRALRASYMVRCTVL